MEQIACNSIPKEPGSDFENVEKSCSIVEEAKTSLIKQGAKNIPDLKGLKELPGMISSAATTVYSMGYNAIMSSKVDDRPPDVLSKLKDGLNQIKPPAYVDWKSHLMDYFSKGGIVQNAFGHSVISLHTLVNNPKFDDECLSLLYLYMVKKNILLSH